MRHTIRVTAGICAALLLIFVMSAVSLAENSAEKKEIRIGLIVSLTGAAAKYGQAILQGAEVAVKSRSTSQTPVRLIVEDDQSEFKASATAYRKLRTVDEIDALIGGSWWLNGIVKTVERDRIPFISCETLYSKDFVKGENYFSLLGDLRRWPSAFLPLIEANQWQSLAMVRFESGFADTLEEELRAIFSRDGRKFLGAQKYSDLEMSAASTLVVKVNSLKPRVVFVDSTPEGFARFAREWQKVGAKDVILISHMAADDAVRRQLFDSSAFEGRLYFLRRSSYSKEFVEAFEREKGRFPELNADLGFYATQLVLRALEMPGDPVKNLKQGLTVEGIKFEFDENNVSHVVEYQVFGLSEGKPVAMKGRVP